MRKFGVNHENGQTILLVEGDAGLRILIRENLEAHGFEVKDAANAAEAIRVAGIWGPNKPDLPLTDARLQDASGTWLAGMLRGRYRSRMAVVYLISDESDMDLLNGSDFHVRKPLSIFGLLTTVDDVLMDLESSAPKLRPVPWLSAMA